MANSKPNILKHRDVHPMISGSVLGIRKTNRLKLPSASKIPARKPALHCTDGSPGQLMSSAMAASLSREYALIA